VRVLNRSTVTAAVVAVVILIAEFLAPAQSGIGVLYVVPLLIATLSGPPRFQYVAAGVATLLTIVGACLILGLFTRLASLGGLAFLLMVYLAAPPWIGYFYAIPAEGSYLIVNKNLIEVAALVVIMLTGSGRFAGVDRILSGLFRRTPRLATA